MVNTKIRNEAQSRRGREIKRIDFKLLEVEVKLDGGCKLERRCFYDDGARNKHGPLTGIVFKCYDLYFIPCEKHINWYISIGYRKIGDMYYIP